MSIMYYGHQCMRCINMKRTFIISTFSIQISTFSIQFPAYILDIIWFSHLWIPCTYFCSFFSVHCWFKFQDEWNIFKHIFKRYKDKNASKAFIIRRIMRKKAIESMKNTPRSISLIPHTHTNSCIHLYPWLYNTYVDR